ncbi:MAG: lipopolysaccharide transport periplasmic protein LptA [Proteobacteria bacterium]|nr:lipopolysaccharide transport periplasmic protein LptA [Pseudomonadota bacterium]MBU1709731.1 lipopolysaccharide transport periplasmic protein LptA [Pseudomonadota bacterium]
MNTLKKNFLIIYIALLLVCLLSATGVLAEDEAARAPQQPIHIEADRMESLKDNDAVMFTGNVEAQQGDLIIHAGKMTVYYSTDGAKSSEPGMGLQKIKKFIATGDVKIIREGWVATGEVVEYFGLEKKVYLTGNTKVLQDNNMVTGDSVTLYLEEGKSIVERSGENGSRVKAFFYPDADNQGETNDKSP